MTDQRIKAIKAALAGKSGFQSQWTVEMLKAELAALKGN